jgi:hypothetical protein
MGSFEEYPYSREGEAQGSGLSCADVLPFSCLKIAAALVKRANYPSRYCRLRCSDFVFYGLRQILLGSYCRVRLRWLVVSGSRAGIGDC